MSMAPSGLADLEVVAHREVVGGHLADGPQRHGVVLTARRDLVGDDVRDLQVGRAQGGVGGPLRLLGLLDLGGQRLGPLEDGGPLLRGRLLHRLGGRLLLRAQVVGPARPPRGGRRRRRGARRPGTRRHHGPAGWHGRCRGARARVAGRSRPDRRWPRRAPGSRRPVAPIAARQSCLPDRVGRADCRRPPAETRACERDRRGATSFRRTRLLRRGRTPWSAGRRSCAHDRRPPATTCGTMDPCASSVTAVRPTT